MIIGTTISFGFDMQRNKKENWNWIKIMFVGNVLCIHQPQLSNTLVLFFLLTKELKLPLRFLHVVLQLQTPSRLMPWMQPVVSSTASVWTFHRGTLETLRNGTHLSECGSNQTGLHQEDGPEPDGATGLSNIRLYPRHCPRPVPITWPLAILDPNVQELHYVPMRDQQLCSSCWSGLKACGKRQLSEIESQIFHKLGLKKKIKIISKSYVIFILFAFIKYLEFLFAIVALII